MTGQRSRRVGISKNSGSGLLRTVDNKPRAVYDANTPQRSGASSRESTAPVEDSPDPLSNDLGPTIFTSKRNPPNRLSGSRKTTSKLADLIPKLDSSSDSDADPLSSKSAPTVTTRSRRTSRQPSLGPQNTNKEPTVTTRSRGASRQPSIEPENSKKDGKLHSKDKKVTLTSKPDSEMNSSDDNWSTSNFIGAIFGGGSSVEDAKKFATRKPNVEPDHRWGRQRRVGKTYGGNRNKLPIKREDKAEPTPISSTDMNGKSSTRDELSDSSLSTLAEEKSVKPPPNGFKNPLKEHKLPPKKLEKKEYVNPLQAHFLPPKKDSDPELAPAPAPARPAFVNPLDSYQLPKGLVNKDILKKEVPKKEAKKYSSDSDSTSSDQGEFLKKRRYINPRAERALETSKEIWAELGVTVTDKEKLKTAFKNPLEEFPNFVMAPSIKDRVASGPLAKKPRTLLDDTSSPSEPAAASSQSSHADPNTSMTAAENEAMNEINNWVGKPNFSISKPSKDSGDICRLCEVVLPEGFLDHYRSIDTFGNNIKLDTWVKICKDHRFQALKKEWNTKKYPDINWKLLPNRLDKNLARLKEILKGGPGVDSPYREQYAVQQKDLRGNTAKLLRTDHKMQNSGYYGPRGANIFAHYITQKLGDEVHEAAKKDLLIAQGGSAAFIQSVLAPELVVRLIVEDMNVTESNARIIMEESSEIGGQLNRDDFTDDLYGEDEDTWLDVNAAANDAAKMNEDTFDCSFDYGYNDPNYS